MRLAEAGRRCRARGRATGARQRVVAREGRAPTGQATAVFFPARSRKLAGWLAAGRVAVARNLPRLVIHVAGLCCGPVHLLSYGEFEVVSFCSP